MAPLGRPARCVGRTRPRILPVTTGLMQKEDGEAKGRRKSVQLVTFDMPDVKKPRSRADGSGRREGAAPEWQTAASAQRRRRREAGPARGRTGGLRPPRLTPPPARRPRPPRRPPPGQPGLQASRTDSSRRRGRRSGAPRVSETPRGGAWGGTRLSPAALLLLTVPSIKVDLQIS